MHGLLWGNQTHKCHTSFQNPGIFRSHNINSRCKKGLVKSKSERNQNLINNQTFLMGDPEKGNPTTPCMGVYKSNIQSDGSLDKLKLIILVKGDLHNKWMIGDTLDTTESRRNLTHLLPDVENHKARVHQLYLFREFLQANFKHRVFVKLDSTYGKYFTEYAKYFGRPLILLLLILLLLLLLLLLVRPPWPYSMIIVGWWKSIPEHRL